MQASPQQQADIRTHIRAKALEYGFALCHFTKPIIAKRDISALDSYVAKGMHADMSWMGEEKRLNMRKNSHLLLDDVKTVICIAMKYLPASYSLAESEATEQKNKGVISAYAHGDDYHDTMKKKLKALAHDLDAMLGQHNQRVFVDTAPILEHALAASAGLGWQGKHSLTIDRQEGSWMLLGEIFTTADIMADLPASEHCGSCTACLDICPTKAIIAPYVVDANLCISYLTIEFKGFIPHKLRPLMGNRIYGCDDCQAVCPWNSKAKIPAHDFLAPRRENILPQLTSLLSLDEEGFRERFRKSPIKRTGRAAFLRNVCIAMGNSGDATLIPALQGMLDDDEPLIRGHAVWAIGVLLGTTISDAEKTGVYDIFKNMKASETHQEVLKEIEAVLSQK